MHRTVSCCLSLSLLCIASLVQAQPRVVVTLPPLHSLVAGVMGEVATPELLLPGGASPHNYSLRPSGMRALTNANLLVWVGEDLETFLLNPLENTDTPRLAVATLEDLQLYPLREGGLWETHGHDDDHGHDDGHDHAHGDQDLHLWLSPANARVVVAAVAERLAKLEPAHAETYRDNAAALDARLQALDARLAEQLAPVQEVPFLVFHDAYQYFERHYDLAGAGAITLDPERQPGAARVREIRQRLQTHDIACVFAEPQFRPALVDNLVEDTGVRTGVLDPLGAALEPGPDAYFQLLENLAAALVDCLGAEA